MRENHCDVVVIGGGSAGMAAAVAIAENGFSVTILEREGEAGGILNQCIHNGFGLHHFREELTGPEYAGRFIAKMKSLPIDFLPRTTAMDFDEGIDRRTVYAFSRRDGVMAISTRAIVLAMGCRERNRGSIGIPGTRPAGVFTAGLAQRRVNVEGYIPGKRVVIVGSGDIGLIMARRMTWVGAKVLGVVEIQPYPSGLTRNIVQCLNDFSIPLYLSHVVSRIHGKDRIEGVTISPLAEGIPDTGRSFDLRCDTLLLSVGLIPDNELSKKLGVSLNPETNGPWVDSSLMTSVPGVFACGNVLHVHDLVDYVTEESERCGAEVCRYLRGELGERRFPISAGANVKYVVPNTYETGRDLRLYLRPLIVKNRAELVVTLDGKPIVRRRLAHVQPSEMISLGLEAGQFPAAERQGDNRIQVALE